MRVSVRLGVGRERGTRFSSSALWNQAVSLSWAAVAPAIGGAATGDGGGGGGGRGVRCSGGAAAPRRLGGRRRRRRRQQAAATARSEGVQTL